MSMFRPKRPILRSMQNPVSVVGGGATVGLGGANAGTPVSVGNQLNSQFRSNWWNYNNYPWWGYNYPMWGCSPYAPWPYNCSPWGYPNTGYQGTPWPYGYAGIYAPY